MKLKIRLNLGALIQLASGSDFEFIFNDITEMNFWSTDDENVTGLHFQVVNNTANLYVFLDNHSLPSYNYSDNDILDASINETYIEFIFDYNVSQYTDLLTLINADAVYLGVDGLIPIFLYRQNSANNVVSKSLRHIGIIQGNFKNVVGLKNLSLDIEKVLIDFTSFNYVWIPYFERYYYVSSVQLMSKDFIRFNFAEDVLMSWETLIKSQNAFVTRQENSTNKDKLVDTRYPLENVKSIEYISITNELSNEVNVTFITNHDANDPYYLVSVMMENLYTKDNVLTIPNSDLPTISPIQTNCQNVYFLTRSQMELFMKALIDQDNYVSYVNSVIALPFNPITPFDATSQLNQLFIGLPSSKVLYNDGKFYYTYDAPSGVSYVPVRRTQYGVSPYLVIADFTFTIDNSWRYREPYSYYEIYIAFVGWVIIDIQSIANKRCLIYYSIDYQTGNATAYLYNYTDKKIIYTTTCQLGTKIDIISSNALEISRERQSVQLNTLIGLLASTVSIGTGVITENPVAVVGGVLSAGKTLANAANSERMLFEKGQVTYGTNEGGLHSNLVTMFRRTYNKAISFTESNYAKLQGYPANYYSSLSGLSGYTEIGDINFNPSNYAISQDEITEIVGLLKNGVIL